MYIHVWMLFLWALSFTGNVEGILPEDSATLSSEHERYPVRQNDKFSNNAYPYLPESGNSLYAEDRDRYYGYGRQCGEKLERALEDIRRRQAVKEKMLHLNGYSLHQPLRTAPLDMYVTDMRVRLPPSNMWVKVEKCRFDPRNQSLDTRLMFRDLTISGKVNLFGEGELQREPIRPLPSEESCNMILRLRKAGIGFHTEPIRKERGQFNVRTDSHFLEPGFISVYAYGCEPELRRRTHRRAHRDDIEEEEETSREMEDIFLKGIRSLLTSYMQKELQPAIKETLMKNMGYTVSYG